MIRLSPEELCLLKGRGQLSPLTLEGRRSWLRPCSQLWELQAGGAGMHFASALRDRHQPRPQTPAGAQIGYKLSYLHNWPVRNLEDI